MSSITISHHIRVLADGSINYSLEIIFILISKTTMKISPLESDCISLSLETKKSSEMKASVAPTVKPINRAILGISFAAIVAATLLMLARIPALSTNRAAVGAASTLKLQTASAKLGTELSGSGKSGFLKITTF